MNYLDIFILTIVGLFTFWGVNKGFIKTFAGMTGFLAALLIATSMVGFLANEIADVLAVSLTAGYIIGYVVLFFGVLIIFKVAAHLILKLFEVTSLRWVDRIGGGAFGFTLGGLLLSLVFIVLSFFTFTERLIPERENSALYPYARDFFPAIYNTVSYVSPKLRTFQDISAEMLKDQPREALMKSEAGRRVLEYLEKLKDPDKDPAS